MSGAFKIFFLILLVFVVLFSSEPRHAYLTEPTFDPDTIPNEPSDYIVAVARAVSSIRPSHGKEIVWRNEDREKTGWSVVYQHGFSTSRRELAPMPEKLRSCLMQIWFSSF